MKFSVPIFLFAMSSSTLSSSSAASSSSSSVLRGSSRNNANDIQQGHRVLQEEMGGTFLVKVTEYPDVERRNLQGNSGNKNPNKIKKQEIAYSIQTSDGMIYDIEEASENWQVGLVSGSDRIAIKAGATMLPNGKIKMNGRKPNKVIDSSHPGQGQGPSRTQGQGKYSGLFERNLREPTPEQQANLDKLNGGGRRELAITGEKTVYAVRIVHDNSTDTTALTKLAPSYNLAKLSDDVFGDRVTGNTDPDAVNLASQYFACSHGKLDFKPTAGKTSEDARVTNIADGVVEVTVSSACPTKPCDGTLRNEVTAALNTAFGTSRAWNIANHAMYCMPPGAMNGIAYAYINSWNSVYSDNWCRYTSVQLHELGHNLNLAHSGEGTNQYADQSGFMGFSYSVDDDKMCFNNAKNWQLGWFSDEATELTLAQSYVGNLKGQVNYGNGNNDSKVIVKVKDPNSDRAFYIGYNHKVKHNSDTREGQNQVTIQEYTGSGYSTSSLIGKIGVQAGLGVEPLDHPLCMSMLVPLIVRIKMMA